MSERVIPEEIRKKNLKRWSEVKLPELLQMLRKVDTRVYMCIANNDFPPLDEVSSSYLHGAVGTGKSVRAAWMLLEWSRLKAVNGKAKQDALFVNVSELLQELRETFSGIGSEHEIIKKYKDIPMLVLDDFGVVKTTEWAYQTFYLILNYRYSHYLPTIITSNHSLGVLADKMNDDRITSRIEHDCGVENILNFKNESKRK